MGALAALASSLLWGTSDFLGGRATGRFGALRVLTWSQLATTLTMWLLVGVLAATGVADVDAHAVGVGALGGVAGVIGLIALYRALAIGPMVLVPPIAACGVALPVIVGLARGSMPSALALAGFACAVVGVILAAYAAPDPASASDGAPQRLAPRTLALCLIAAAGFALVFVALDIAAGDSASTAIVATAGVRIGSLLTVLISAAVLRIDPRTGVNVRSAASFAGIGAIDTSANLAFAVAATIGRLEVVAVLASLYPAVTSGLAALLLGERVALRQLVGVVLTIGGIVLLASG
jgi:drug/metabolite transporter (DMT)-like permease